MAGGSETHNLIAGNVYRDGHMAPPRGPREAELPGRVTKPSFVRSPSSPGGSAVVPGDSGCGACLILPGLEYGTPSGQRDGYALS